MKIGDRIFVRGYIDEIRKDTVIVRNDGGCFGTVLSEVTGELPSAQPEQRTGKWNTYYHGVNENPSFTYSCNQCGHSAPYGLYGGKYSQKKWAYCPNCGTRMEGEEHETD